MNKLILSITCLFYGFTGLSQDFGKIEIVKRYSQELKQTREFFIYTPSYYEESQWKYYDVIYVFDAQTRQFFDLTHALLPFVSKEVDNPYIVVGLIATYDEELDYGRNDDLLPQPINVENSRFFGHGNANNFFNYIKKELIPYVEENYRTLSERIAIGHSLSASFVLSTLIKDPTVFDGYLAISPNLAYDKNRLAEELIASDWDALEERKWLYFSHADEGIDYWKSWKPAREKLYRFLEEKNPDSVQYQIDELPDYNHWTTFVPGLINGLTSYHRHLESLPKKTYETTITVKVPDASDDVYITGNQEVLGDWDEGKVKMNRTADRERSITLNLQSSTFIRFTRGNSETEAVLPDYDLAYLYHIPISPAKTQSFTFEIVNWKDRMNK